MPVALLEAMAAGLPYVATDVDGNSEIAVPEAGRLVPPEEPAVLAAAIVAFGQDGVAEKAGGCAVEFSRARTVAEYVSILTDIDCQEACAGCRRWRRPGSRR